MKVRPRSRRTPRRSPDQRYLAARIESVREEERKRLAVEIHDVLGQALSGLKMQMAWIASRLRNRDSKLIRRARAMSRLIDSTVQRARKIATELRPGILDQLGLFAAIEWQCEQFQKRTGISCRCLIGCPDQKLHKKVSSGLFRILQEILLYYGRQGRAKPVEVVVRNRGGNLLLQVSHQSGGIRASDMRKGISLGTPGLRERAHILGGELIIRGSRGRGTSVVVKIPARSGTVKLPKGLRH